MFYFLQFLYYKKIEIFKFYTAFNNYLIRIIHLTIMAAEAVDEVVNVSSVVTAVLSDYYLNIKNLPYYYEEMTSSLADKYFKGPGVENTYVLRPSGQYPGNFAVTYYTQEAVITGYNAPKKGNAPIKHITLYLKPGVGLSTDKTFLADKVHTSVHAAIVDRLKKPLYAGGQPASYAEKLLPYNGPRLEWVPNSGATSTVPATSASSTVPVTSAASTVLPTGASVALTYSNYQRVAPLTGAAVAGVTSYRLNRTKLNASFIMRKKRTNTLRTGTINLTVNVTACGNWEILNEHNCENYSIVEEIKLTEEEYNDPANWIC